MSHAKTPSSQRWMSQTINMQWHLTNRCNWRCAHCYHDSYRGDELNIAELQRVFLEYLALARCHGLSPRLTLTGGEPFVRADFIDFLAFLSQHRDSVQDCVILTNGSLITDALISDIKKRAPIVSEIQLSIEGEQATNDDIRGTGAFDTALAAAARLKHAGIPVHLAATISKKNYKAIWELIDALLIYDIPLHVRRFIPIGLGGTHMHDALLSPTELRDVYIRVRELNATYHLSGGRQIVQDNMCTSGPKYLDWSDEPHRTCGVRHKRTLTIMPNGDVYPCRLAPVLIGNVTQQSLASIYEHTYNQFLEKSRQDPRCTSCPVYPACQGGAPCVSLAVTNNFYARDPQCWSE